MELFFTDSEIMFGLDVRIHVELITGKKNNNHPTTESVTQRAKI